MRRFIERALAKLAKLDADQIHTVINYLAGENDRLEMVLDSMDDAVLTADVDHNLVLYNKAAERLLPLTGRDAYERPLWEAIDDEQIAVFVRESLEGQERVVDREFAIEKSSGVRLIELSITPLVREGHIQGSLVRAIDATDRRSREARLRRAESLASLTTLAAGLAHEIKNPLGSIGIHMQLLQKSMGEVGKDTKGFIEVVNEEVDRLNRIVVDFLFAVRPMDTNLIESDLNEIVHELLEFVRFELEEAGIDLIEELDETLPALDLDEKYLKQAILNIVKNAISAMPQGGTLRVTSRHEGDVAVLEVVDTGQGIPESIIDKVFEPYFTTKDFGSGIGLTLVYKVVKEHGGEITVRSHEGKGTSFVVALPIPQREQHLISYSEDRGGTDQP